MQGCRCLIYPVTFFPSFQTPVCIHCRNLAMLAPWASCEPQRTGDRFGYSPCLHSQLSSYRCGLRLEVFSDRFNHTLLNCNNCIICCGKAVSLPFPICSSLFHNFIYPLATSLRFLHHTMLCLRIMFVLPVAMALVQAIAMGFMPSSPRWLALVGRFDEVLCPHDVKEKQERGRRERERETDRERERDRVCVCVKEREKEKNERMKEKNEEKGKKKNKPRGERERREFFPYVLRLHILLEGSSPMLTLLYALYTTILGPQHSHKNSGSLRCARRARGLACDRPAECTGLFVRDIINFFASFSLSRVWLIFLFCNLARAIKPPAFLSLRMRPLAAP